MVNRSDVSEEESQIDLANALLNRGVNWIISSGVAGLHGTSIENFVSMLKTGTIEMDTQNIKSLRFFKTYQYEAKEKNMIVELNVFLCNIHDVEKIDVKEGKPATLKIKETFDLNISEMDKKILKEVYDYIKLGLKMSKTAP